MGVGPFDFEPSANAAPLSFLGAIDGSLRFGLRREASQEGRGTPPTNSEHLQ